MMREQDWARHPWSVAVPMTCLFMGQVRRMKLKRLTGIKHEVA
jgi:hypothetical protein